MLGLACGSHVWVRAWKASWNLEEKREPRWVEKQWNQDMLVCSKFNFNVEEHVLIKKGGIPAKSSLEPSCR